MIKWIVFAVLSLVWIATCWFFGNMVAGTAAIIPAKMARDECVQRAIAVAAARGVTMTQIEAEQTEECRRIHDRKFDELAGPPIRKGLLWGVVPVILIGGLMLLRSRG